MDVSDLLLEDDRSRRRAIEAASFIVEAPAGAGKTELLTQRYLKLLSAVAEPEEIVAITFTNKAAAEMRSRVLQSLQDAVDNTAISQPHKKMTRELALAALARSDSQGWDLLSQPARLRINTIDALCGLLARQMPLMSRLGAQSAVSDDASVHYQEAARRTLAMLEEKSGSELIAEVLAYYDNDIVRLNRLLSSMLEKRDQWLPYATRQPMQQEAEKALHHLLTQDILRAAEFITVPVQERLMPLARYAASNLPEDDPMALLADWNMPLAVEPSALALWQSLCTLLLTQKAGWRKVFNVKLGFPAGKQSKPYKDALTEIIAELPEPQPLARLLKLPQPDQHDEEWRIIGNLAALLQLAAAHLTTVFQEAGEIDFSEVISRALTALGDDSDPTELALRLDYRIQHLLVDEFQDTSPNQVRLLEKLTSGWQADDGRTLFCVGDPMQSIYRFRKAEVGLFLKVAETGIGDLQLERLHLYRNNRSCPSIVNWVNTAFANVFPRHDDANSGNICYRPFAATRSSLPDEGVFVHPVITQHAVPAEASAELEANTITKLILELQSLDPTRTIAVLVKARSHLNALVANIRKHHKNIRFQAVEIEALAGRQIVQDMLSLTYALLHRADRVHWLAILRAPWCGLTLADLHILAADDHHATIWTLMNDEARIQRMSADGQQRLIQMRGILASALANRGRQSLRRWIESTWLMLGGAQCLWEAGDVNDVQALLDLIGHLHARGELSKLSPQAEKLYAAVDSAADGCLQFMTIHKSKGLEFDTVILPGLHRGNQNDDNSLVLWEEVALEKGKTNLVAAPLVPKYRKNNAISAYDYLSLMEKERNANENSRVLYVAATRAVRGLHLVGVARSDSESGEIKVTANTPLQLLWPTLAAKFEQATVSQSQATRHNTEFVPQLIRRKQAKSVMAISAQPPITRSVHLEQDNTQTGHQVEADIGTLAHRYVELIAQTGLQEWDLQRIEKLRPAMVCWLQQRGHAADVAHQAAQSVTASLRATLDSDSGRWILSSQQQSGAELALVTTDHNNLSTHVIDRTFVYQDERWIIDYKSTYLGEAVQLDVLQNEACQYRPQLENYARLFRHEGLTVRMAIFFMAYGQLVEFDGP